MSGQLSPDEAAHALAQIRDRQEQAIDATGIPTWYWWLVGGLIVVLAAAVESRHSVTTGVGVGVFVLGLVAGTGWVVFGALRVHPRNALLGRRGVGAIVGFVGLVLAVTFAVAFGLSAAGVPHPATWANVVGAVLLAAGGPRLTRSLHRIMLGHRAAGTR